MKKIFSRMAHAVASVATAAAATLGAEAAPALKVDRVEPPYWWTGMATDTLQIMLSGPDIAGATASLDYPGVTIAEQVRLDSPNYLLLYLKIGKDAAPGTLPIHLREGKKQTTIPYQLKQREPGSAERKGFDASDVLYLVMPDRFASDGRDHSKAVKDMDYPITPNRENPNGRHGGNIGGLRQHLDYIDSLGVTAVWVCPVLENDMPGGSYHGYATTDYYRIDPRLGTNEEWREFIDEAHKRGIKVVMDMIFNHSGSNHPWMKDMPSKDWYNFPDKFVQTNYRLSTVHDPYVSDYDYKRTVYGWFVESMPDLNQRNKHLMKYLTQNSIWWIEDAGIDGIRMDTHPYADFDGMAGWLKDVRSEYPAFNIVGECWYGNEGGEAFWQKGSFTNRKGDPELETVMDFVLSIKARDAFSSQTDPWNGINVMYDHLALDYLFPDPTKILTFLDNHDTDRFLLEEPEDLGWWKQALAFLLTTRGIPQLYYGTEILMNGSKEGSDGYVRRDMPGGFPDDSGEVNAFTGKGLTDKQKEAMEFMKKVLNWRKGNEVIAKGSLKHFMPYQGVYVYERRLGDRQVVLMMNGNDKPVTMDMEQTLEILPYGTQKRDMLSGETVTITEEMTFPPRALYILE